LIAQAPRRLSGDGNYTDRVLLRSSILQLSG